MIRTIELGLVTLLMIPASTSADGWTVSTELERKSWLPGEPIGLSVTYTNNTNRHLAHPFTISEDPPRAPLFLDGARCLPVVLVFRDRPLGEPVPTEPPGKELTRSYDLAMECSLGLGMKRDLIGKHVLCVRGRDIEEHCVEFTIQEPTGQDKIAFDLLPKPQWDVSGLDGDEWGEVITQAPTSIYSGHLMAKRKALVSSGTSDLEESVTILETVDLARLGLTVADVMERNQELATFLGAHPDFAKRDRLLYELGITYIVLHDWQGAVDAFDKAAENDGQWKELAAGLAEMVRKSKDLT
jgi:hypothetical protein